MSEHDDDDQAPADRWLADTYPTDDGTPATATEILAQTMHRAQQDQLEQTMREIAERQGVEWPDERSIDVNDSTQTARSSKRPFWRLYAACLGMDTAIFFPERGQPAGPALKVCAGCLVRQQCLEDALDFDRRSGAGFGVAGGLPAKRRRQLAAARNEAARNDSATLSTDDLADLLGIPAQSIRGAAADWARREEWPQRLTGLPAPQRTAIGYLWDSEQVWRWLDEITTPEPAVTVRPVDNCNHPVAPRSRLAQRGAECGTVDGWLNHWLAGEHCAECDAGHEARMLERRAWWERWRADREAMVAAAFEDRIERRQAAAAPPPPPPRRPERPPCGTKRGYRFHLSSGEPACDECRAVMAEAQRERYRRQRTAA